MLGFTPLAAAPLADDGVEVSTGGATSVTVNDITAGAPAVDGISLSLVYNFNADDITTTPVVDAIGTPITYNLSVDSIETTPVVDAVSVGVIHVFNANDVTSTPVVDSATALFTDVLSAVSLGPEVTNYTVTVADNGGNKFFIDGTSNPALSLVRGQKYVFDLSDSSNTGHPLVFTLSDGTTSYTDGVTSVGTAGSSGATVTFLVPSDAPASLRYVCSVHGSGMGNTISVSTQTIGLQPAVDDAAPQYTDVLAANEITVGSPSVDAATPQYTDVLSADEITLGTPIVDTAPVFENETCDVDDIASGAPVVDAASVQYTDVLAADGITASAPQIDTLPFFQEYALTMVEITAGVPTLPARFTWDYQEPPTDSWTDQADDDSVWTTQADSSDTWTEATEPTDIWTDVTDPTDTWSEAA